MIFSWGTSIKDVRFFEIPTYVLCTKDLIMKIWTRTVVTLPLFLFKFLWISLYIYTIYLCTMSDFTWHTYLHKNRTSITDGPYEWTQNWRQFCLTLKSVFLWDFLYYTVLNLIVMIDGNSRRTSNWCVSIKINLYSIFVA